MSVDFWCPTAPDSDCHCDGKDDLCFDCYGTGTARSEPGVNLSNLNAGGLLRLLGLYGGELYGSLKVTEIPPVLRTILVTYNTVTLRAHLVEPASVERGSQGARVIEQGNADAQTLRRLARIRELLVWAIEHDHAVSWG